MARILAAQAGWENSGGAVRISLRQYSLLSPGGFRPGLFSDCVGYLLRSQVLKQLIVEGVRRYNFLGGEDPSKERWGTQEGSYLFVRFAKPFTLGSACIRLQQEAKATKEWLRAHLPDSAFSLLRAIYRMVHPAQGVQHPTVPISRGSSRE